MEVTAAMVGELADSGERRERESWHGNGRLDEARLEEVWYERSG